MEKQLSSYPIHRTIAISIALTVTLATIATLTLTPPKFEFYSQFGIPLLILLIPTFPFEQNLLFFYFQTASVLIFAANSLQKYIILGSIFFAFLAVITASNPVSQTSASLFAGFVTFHHFAESSEIEFASIFVVVFSVSFGDFGACLMGIMSQLGGQQQVIMALISGVFAGAVSMGIKLVQGREGQKQRVRRMQSHAVQNAFVTVRE